MGGFDFARNCGGGTVACAERAALALVGVDVEVKQLLAYAGGTAFFGNVSFILIAEIAQCGQNRVWRGLTEAAERVFLDIVAKSFEFVEVFKLSVSGGDFLENFKHTAVEIGRASCRERV